MHLLLPVLCYIRYNMLMGLVRRFGIMIHTKYISTLLSFIVHNVALELIGVSTCIDIYQTTSSTFRRM